MTDVTVRLTERLLLRGWRQEDREPFAALNGDAETMAWFPAPLTREQSDAMIDRVAPLLEQQDWGLWAVEERSTAEFLGFTGLNVPRFEAPFLPAVEIGWRLRRSAWGHGYASEAAREAARIAFDEVGLDGLVSFTSVGNRRSRAVMERLGMTRDPAEDFDHPTVDPTSPLRRHVLYRLPRPR